MPPWHSPNPRLAHAKVGGGWDKASLGRAQARKRLEPIITRPPSTRVQIFRKVPILETLDPVDKPSIRRSLASQSLRRQSSWRGRVSTWQRRVSTQRSRAPPRQRRASCVLIRASCELPNQAPWAHSQAPVSLGQAGLGIVPIVA
ncbi:hypothetical protein PGT21_016113 [Puccinia graminis f. sp. tritici]|uniref:Uncharacterized protein n=1 Tax=Puccinia graminis f. sp. tritici TaxID=56615 RepID=A0A5B0MLP5_PUCGR|nr:hypothetical protein PGT21_016113 [Puccinia graminis f. sp. tritici]